MKKIKIKPSVVVIAFSVFISILAVSSGVFVYTQDKEVSVTDKAKKDEQLTVALVNEDAGGNLNNVNYNFGQEFTNLLTNAGDSKENWVTMPRSLAESKYSDGSADVIIYISNDFSDKILQLESFNPSQAKIGYKVKKSTDTVKEKNVESQVGTYLNLINQRVIKMYFSSVIGNLDDAKRNVANIVNDQETSYTSLSNYIYTPSNAASQNLGGLTSYATALQSGNKAFEDSQANFTKGVFEMLNSTSNGLNGELPEVKSFVDLQADIAKSNVATANTAISDQFKTDTDLYNNLNDNALSSLNKFYAPSAITSESNGGNTVYNLFANSISDYNGIIENYRSQVENTRNRLMDLLNQVQGTRSKVSEQYFNADLGLDKNNYLGIGNREDRKSAIKGDVQNQVTNQQVKDALANQIKSSLGGTLPSEYEGEIANLMGSIDVNSADYNALFSKLESMGAITSDEVAAYQAKLSLLSQYQAVKGVTTAGGATYSFLTAEDAKPSQSNVVSINVAPTSTQVTTQVTDSAKDASEAELKDKQTNSQESTETKQDATTVAITDVSGGRVVFADDCSTSKQITSAQSLKIAYTFDSLAVGTHTINFNLKIGDSTIPMTYTTFVTDTADDVALVKEDLKAILAQLSNISTAAAMVQTLYGEPGQTDLSKVNVANPSANSVVKMYGNLTYDNIAGLDIDNYKNSGLTLYTELTNEMTELQSAINDLPGLSDERLPRNYFAQGLQSLVAWYNSAADSLNAEFSNWSHNQAKVLNVAPYGSGNADGTSLYVDASSGDALYSSISELVKSTSDNAQSTTSNYQALGTMTDQFTQLVSQVNTIQKDVDDTMANTNKLISSQAGNIQESTTYATNFSKVLKNARSGGTDNEAVMNFLSNPVNITKKTTSGVVAEKDNKIWIVVTALVSSILSIIVTYFLTKSSKPKSN
ncbi:type VII secretion protein EsaA, N-terminal domain-containing protein [Streptococcus equinus]|uniref:type VII secretion protein EsaA n=1 Tax=Streptococcus equinus TaxID=1335 RepID=UPI0008712861|nr:type VII secretion protein EsaA [Streptococcus equinus]SCW51970.1 type VII secretion protein EsaA, N-terminal domain-containing protein [Streptococcus equinus]